MQQVHFSGQVRASLGWLTTVFFESTAAKHLPNIGCFETNTEINQSKDPSALVGCLDDILITITLISVLQSRSMRPPALFFFFFSKINLGIQGPLCFSISFRINFSMSAKICHWDFGTA